MTLRKRFEAAGDAVIAFDGSTQDVFEPYRDIAESLPVTLASKLGDQPELRAVATALMVAGTFADSDRMVRVGARMIIAHEAATAIKDRLKLNIDRTRPRSKSGGSASKPKKGEHKAKELSSFPSGHSAGAIAAARAFAREYPDHGTAVTVAAAVIAALQIPRLAHYPSDVVAGLAIGIAAEAATNAAWNAADMDHRSRSIAADREI
jgi:membrane-associated phospholipid phosphatase